MATADGASGRGRRGDDGGKKPKKFPFLTPDEQWALYSPNSLDNKLPVTREEKQAGMLVRLRKLGVPEDELELNLDVPPGLVHQDNGGNIDQGNRDLSTNYRSIKANRLNYFKQSLSQVMTPQIQGELKGTLNELQRLELLADTLMGQVRDFGGTPFETPDVFKVQVDEKANQIMQKKKLESNKK